jgi:hypothetical protein
MIISEQYKNNLKRLAGLIKEGVQFRAAVQGRSEPGTLSWYSEEYILNLAENIVNSLDSQITNMGGLVLEISRDATKIASNNFATKLNIKKQDDLNKSNEFLLTISVNFEQNSNTAVSVTIKGVTNKFTMNSKHSASDLENLKNQTVESFLNSLSLLNKD